MVTAGLYSTITQHQVFNRSVRIRSSVPIPRILPIRCPPPIVIADQLIQTGDVQHDHGHRQSQQECGRYPQDSRWEHVHIPVEEQVHSERRLAIDLLQQIYPEGCRPHRDDHPGYRREDGALSKKILGP